MPNDVAGALFPSVTTNPPQGPAETEARSDAADTVVPAEEDETTDQAAPTESPPGEEGTEPEVPTPAEDGLGVIIEQFQSAIQSLDGAMQAMHADVTAIASRVESLETRAREPVATQVAHLVDDPTWIQSLWSATRSGRALRASDVEEGGGDDPLPQSAQMLQALGNIGDASADPGDILGSIISSQRRS